MEFVLVGLAILAIYWLFEKIYAKIKENLCRKEIARLLPSINLVAEGLNDLFSPTKELSLKELEDFISTNKEIVDAVNKLCSNEYANYSLLEKSGINSFRESVTKDSLFLKLVENNKVFKSINRIPIICDEAQKQYPKLIDDNHYFTYSEEEKYILLLDRLEGEVNVVCPKYTNYINDNRYKGLLDIKKNLDFHRKTHNEDFIRRELTANKTYFDRVLGSYPLDQQQRNSIVKLEDNCLVIASAGSGKTSTILGKAKYLVEKRNIDPSKILLITYTRKAANELHERMQIEGMTCCTFHKLAMDIISKVTGKAPSPCAKDIQQRIFHDMIENNDSFLHSVNNYIINEQSMMGLEHEYDDAFSYYEDRKKYGILALFPDTEGKIIFTKSEEEKRLVSILTRLGISFRYESIYPYNTATAEYRQYKPDFTIYYQDDNGNEKQLYLEHFAIDSEGHVPNWFSDGESDGWQKANRKYKEGIIWKRLTHSHNNTILIETTSADFRDGTVETKLRQQFRKYGVPIKELSDEELHKLLVKRNRRFEKSVSTLIQSFVTLMKANEKTVNGLLNELEAKSNDNELSPIDQRNKSVLINIIKPFYNEYQRTLMVRGEIDFTDCIIQATELCRRGLWQHYDYILVDEFQDISIDRYKFLQALRGEGFNTKLFCVGDDWQSIFRFSGSDMSLVYEFEKYFGYTEHCKIETTYRFHQPLIDKSSEFIMKNKEQKEKSIKSPVGDIYKTYLNFVKCDCDKEDAVLKKVKEIVETVPSEDSILLLGRYNYDAASVGYKGSISDKDKQMTVNIGGRDLPFLSVHSAKGLEADYVILVNCNQGAFPSIIEDDPILDFVLSKSEAYPFAEERRLFYVAMTRAKKSMFILYDQKRPSPFIGEFLLRIERGSYLCPRCLEGKMVVIKEGKTTNGDDFRSFACSNNGAGCDFFETKFGDLTPPGIHITEEMTSQDIERLREERRRESKQYVRVIIPPAPFAPPPPEPQGSADDLPF